MCIAGVVWQPNSNVPLIVLSNRDEFTSRTASPLHWWANGTLAGKDLQAGGTWLGALPKADKLALVTNVREPSGAGTAKLSRGSIVGDFLHSPMGANAFAASYTLHDYTGVNVLLYDGSGLLLCSNRAIAPIVLPAGVYSISNGVLLKAWPKTLKLARSIALSVQVANVQLSSQLSVLTQLRASDAHQLHQPLLDAALAALADRALVADKQTLPKTGVGEEIEHLLSAICVDMPGYATVASSLFVHSRLGWYAAEFSCQTQQLVRLWHAY